MIAGLTLSPDNESGAIVTWCSTDIENHIINNNFGHRAVEKSAPSPLMPQTQTTVTARKSRYRSRCLRENVRQLTTCPKQDTSRDFRLSVVKSSFVGYLPLRTVGRSSCGNARISHAGSACHTHLQPITEPHSQFLNLWVSSIFVCEQSYTFLFCAG